MHKIRTIPHSKQEYFLIDKGECGLPPHQGCRWIRSIAIKNKSKARETWSFFVAKAIRGSMISKKGRKSKKWIR